MNMREVVPDAVQRLMALPVVGLDEAADDFDVVKGFLTRFGYLPDTVGAAASGAKQAPLVSRTSRQTCSTK